MYKPCYTLKAIAVFYTCLTGGLRYRQKQNISVCMSRANRPMKPFIKKTFAPEQHLQRPEMGTPHECWMFFKLYFFILDFSSKHTFDLIEFTDFIALHLFLGQLRGVVEKYFHWEFPPWVPSRFCPPLAVCPWTSHLTFCGAGGCSAFGSIEVELSELQLLLSVPASWIPRDSDSQPVWHF